MLIKLILTIILTNPGIIGVKFETSEGMNPIIFYEKDVETSLLLPKNFNIMEKNKFVLYINGSNGKLEHQWEEANLRSVITELLDNGYVVIASSYTSNTNWGNTQSIIDTEKVIKTYQKALNLEVKPYVIAQSMGGMVMINSINRGLLQPKAVVGIYPALNLDNIYSTNLNSYIDEAYNINDDNPYPKAIKGYNPLNENLNKEFANIPFLIWHSYQDTIVERKPNTDLFTSKLKAMDGNIKLITTEGEHGDITNFDGKKVVEFFKNN